MTAMPRVKYFIFYCCALVLPLFLLVSLEAVLALGNWLTGSSKFAPLAPPDITGDYPAIPGECLKIAVFGGSAANGYNSERSFTELISYELRQHFPNRRFYIRNFARNGHPFHRHQAEFVKAQIDSFDVFILYVGNNEALNWLDDTGYFRRPDKKDARSLQPAAVEMVGTPVNDLRNFLEHHSRIYAIASKAWIRLSSSHSRQPPPRTYESGKVWFREFEPQKVLPSAEIEQMKANFASNLEEIGRLAENSDKVVIVSIAASDPNYSPLFSVHRPGLSEKDLAAFDTLFTRGTSYYRNHDYREALPLYLSALQVDDQVAILNHRLGCIYRQLGEYTKGWAFYHRGLDEDGLIFRPLSSYAEAARALSQRNRHVHFVDAIGSFRPYWDTDPLQEALFADFQHPAFAGHVALAQLFLGKMGEIEGLSIGSLKGRHSQLTAGRLDSLTALYRRQLGVKKAEAYLMAFMRMRWLFSMANESAYPEEFLDAAEKNISQMWDLSPRDSQQEAVRLFFLALIEGRRGNAAAALSLANQAISVSPDQTQKILLGDFLLGEYWLYSLNDLGLDYSPTEHRIFQLPADTTSNNSSSALLEPGMTAQRSSG
jgi:tetratricopeptide (TPR) repeat protein